jgi:hypothetical protein
MVKVTGPLHSVEARGRLGDLEYNTWRGLSVVRVHKDPDPPISTRQQTQQANFKAITLVWKTLTDAQRATWTNYADRHPGLDWSGKPIHMSGFNAYCKLNAWRQFLSATLLTTAPAMCFFPILTTMAINYEGVDPILTFNFTTFSGSSQYDTLLRSAGPYSAGRQADIHHAVYVVHGTLASKSLTIPHAGLEVNKYYGYWLRSVHYQSGQTSPWYFLRSQYTLPE